MATVKEEDQVKDHRDAVVEETEVVKEVLKQKLDLRTEVALMLPAMVVV